MTVWRRTLPKKVYPRLEVIHTDCLCLEAILLVCYIIPGVLCYIIAGGVVLYNSGGVKSALPTLAFSKFLFLFFAKHNHVITAPDKDIIFLAPLPQ